MISRREMLGGALGASLFPAQAFALQAAASAEILFRNVRVFDGKSLRLSGPTDVFVRGNQIAGIGRGTSSAGRVIEGRERTLMPGLIDAHWHMMMASLSMAELMSVEPGFIHINGAREASDVLMRGFTSVRDLSGPVFGVRRAIARGIVPGPRIWASGAMISQTSGHGDFRMLADLPSAGERIEPASVRFGIGVIADGVPEVLRAVREQLMQGANQIKLAAGGGVSSNFDPIDVAQYTEEEFRAASLAAENWGTYVTVHAYTPHAIQTAVRGGVRCVDHGQMMDEATARLLAERGIWLCLQPFIEEEGEQSTRFAEGSENRAKQLQMYAGTDEAYALAKRFGIKTTFGTDALFDPRAASRQGAQLARLIRWYSPAEVLRMATGTNAELLALSGPRNPWPGRLGVVEQGALADLLLVNGDPIENINLIADPDASFAVIMKDGRIYKDAVG